MKKHGKKKIKQKTNEQNIKKNKNVKNKKNLRI